MDTIRSVERRSYIWISVGCKLIATIGLWIPNWIGQIIGAGVIAVGSIFIFTSGPNWILGILMAIMILIEIILTVTQIFKQKQYVTKIISTILLVLFWIPIAFLIRNPKPQQQQITQEVKKEKQVDYSKIKPLTNVHVQYKDEQQIYQSFKDFYDITSDDISLLTQYIRNLRDQQNPYFNLYFEKIYTNNSNEIVWSTIVLFDKQNKIFKVFQGPNRDKVRGDTGTNEKLNDVFIKKLNGEVKTIHYNVNIFSK